MDRANELRRVAGERQKAANAVARKAEEVARQCNSAGSLEAVKCAQRVVEAVASQVREVAGEIEREAAGASRGEPSEDADLHEARQKLDAVMGQLVGESATLGAPHNRPDEDTRDQIDSAAGDVESAAGQVESAVGDIESAVGRVESAIGDVQGQVAQAESIFTEAEAKVTRNQRATADRRTQISIDQRLIQECERQLNSLDPARGMHLLAQYTAAVRWFNPRLSIATASRLARAVCSAGARRGVDARFLLSILVAEGALDQLQSSHGRISGRPLEETALALADDVHQRLKHAAGADARQPTLDQLVRVLLERYKSRRGASGKGAQRYSQKVAHLYYQMCGLKPPGD